MSSGALTILHGGGRFRRRNEKSYLRFDFAHVLASAITQIVNNTTIRGNHFDSFDSGSPKNRERTPISISNPPRRKRIRLTLYLDFSSFEAVLYPAIRKSPTPIRITIPRRDSIDAVIICDVVILIAWFQIQR